MLLTSSVLLPAAALQVPTAVVLSAACKWQPGSRQWFPLEAAGSLSCVGVEASGPLSEFRRLVESRSS